MVTHLTTAIVINVPFFPSRGGYTASIIVTYRTRRVSRILSPQTCLTKYKNFMKRDKKEPEKIEMLYLGYTPNGSSRSIIITQAFYSIVVFSGERAFELTKRYVITMYLVARRIKKKKIEK